MPVINVNTKASGGTRRPLAEGEWEVKLVEVKYKESSQKKTPGVELTFQVLDADAVDTTGQRFKGNVWETLWITEKGFWRVAKTASSMGLDLDLEEDEEGNAQVDAEELVDVFRDAVGDEFTVVTYLEEDGNGKTYPGSDEVKQYVRVDEVK